jgi:uncharacterized membrane protein
MSSLEKRAWLMLWSMCPAYAVYFAIQAGLPALLPTMSTHILCLAIVSGTHAAIYLTGVLLIRRNESGEATLEDERDVAIDRRASRTAYFILLTGMIVVGVVMPFNRQGWQIVNTALLAIVLSETVRYALIVVSYRRPRLAH